MKSLAAFLTAALLAASAMAADAPAAPQADLAKGSESYGAVCVACHGADGNGIGDPQYPLLAGQFPDYLAKALRDYKSGERDNAIMKGFASTLSDQDMLDLAAYFASRTRNPSATQPQQGSEGERLYRGGNKDTGVTACAACHGPHGSGNAPAGYPALGGQQAAYVATQLRAYRAGQRSSDLNQMMRNTSARLTDAEIDAVASYIQGLR